MSWIELLGYCGAVLYVVTNLMRTMIPLRALAMLCNAIFVVYFVAHHLFPNALLQLLLFPINGYRLREMIRLTRRVRAAVAGDDTMNWLKPFMTRRRYRSGDLLFAKGATAEEMFYVVSGRYRVMELGVDVPKGEVFGELGLLAPEQRRTGSIQCVEDGEVLVIGYSAVKELYYQNPEFGFYFLGLATGRLFGNLQRLEAEVQTLRARLADPKPPEAAATLA